MACLWCNLVNLAKLASYAHSDRQLLDSRFWSLHPFEFLQQVKVLTGVLTWILRMRRLHNSCVSGDALVCGGCCSGGSESIRGGVCGVRFYRNQKWTLKSLPPSPNLDLFQKKRTARWGGRVSLLPVNAQPQRSLVLFERPAEMKLLKHKAWYTQWVCTIQAFPRRGKKSHQNVRQVFLGSR